MMSELTFVTPSVSKAKAIARPIWLADCAEPLRVTSPLCAWTSMFKDDSSLSAWSLFFTRVMMTESSILPVGAPAPTSLVRTMVTPRSISAWRSVGARRHSVMCAVLCVPLVVVEAILAELPLVLVLEVDAPAAPVVDEVLLGLSLLATEALVLLVEVDGVLLAPSEPEAEPDAAVVSLEATEALVEAVDVLLVADGAEALMPELLLVSLLATDDLLLDGVVLEADVLGVELLEVLAWLLVSLLAKPAEEEEEAGVDAVEELADGEALEEVSLLASPAAAPVLEVEVEAVEEGEDAELALDWSLLAKLLEDSVVEVEVDDVAEGAEAELLLD